MDSRYIIEVEGLKKYYDSVKAVDGISFGVKYGEIFGMLGPNGAGKTTTIETIIGLLEKTGGEIRVLGMDPGKEGKDIKPRIGVQLQNPSLFPRLTVSEIIDLFGYFYPEPLTIDETIELVGLQESKKVRVNSLSGGQKHRLAVALAMVGDGELVFLDEPTTGLDPQARRNLWEVIRELKKGGVTVFLTTHYMDEAETLCDDLVIIDRGEIIASGSPKNLIDRHFERRALEFADPGFTREEKSKLKTIMGDYEEDEERIITYSKNTALVFEKLMDYARDIGKPIDDAVIRRATLEDVFLKITGRRISEDE